MPAIVFKSIFKVMCTLAALRQSAQSVEIAAKLRLAAPYALMELFLPGGSVMALLLWLYRRRKKSPVLTASAGNACGCVGSCL